MTDWQPIETAPRDQRRVLIGYFDTEGIWRERIAFWGIPYEGAPKEAGWWHADGGGTSLSADVHTKWTDGKPLGVTHWMPLPEPPEGPR